MRRCGRSKGGRRERTPLLKGITARLRGYSSVRNTSIAASGKRPSKIVAYPRGELALGYVEIVTVNIEAHTRYSQSLRSNRRASEADDGIKHAPYFRYAVQFDAHLG